MTTSAIEGRIAAQRERLLQRIRSFRAQLDDFVDSAALSPPDDEHDPEGATIAFERAQVATLLEDARTQLSELDEALVRFSTGTYGRCRDCGNPIPEERLIARPASATCVTCAGRKK